MSRPAQGWTAQTGGVQSKNRPVLRRTLVRTSWPRPRDDLAQHHPPDSRRQGGFRFAEQKGHRKQWVLVIRPTGRLSPMRSARRNGDPQNPGNFLDFAGVLNLSDPVEQDEFKLIGATLSAHKGHKRNRIKIDPFYAVVLCRDSK